MVATKRHWWAMNETSLRMASGRERNTLVARAKGNRMRKAIFSGFFFAILPTPAHAGRGEVNSHSLESIGPLLRRQAENLIHLFTKASINAS